MATPFGVLKIAARHSTVGLISDIAAMRHRARRLEPPPEKTVAVLNAIQDSLNIILTALDGLPDLKHPEEPT